jgi:ABC-type lipoprotein release transport system permease subunit
MNNLSRTGCGNTPGVSSVPQSDGRLAGMWCFLGLTFQGIRSSRLQLILTILTMSVGTMAMALTFFIGRGATARAWSDVERMMGQWVVAFSDAGIEQRWVGKRYAADFTDADLRELKDHLSEARLVCPIYMSAHPVMYHNQTVVLPVDGIVSEMDGENLFRPISGLGFSASANAGLAWECMVTERAVDDLGIDLTGQPLLLIGGQPFRVVGVVSNPPRVDKRFQGRIVVPYQSARILWIPAGTVGHIVVAWRRVEDMDQTVKHLRQALDQIRGPDTYYLSSSVFSIERSKDVVTNFMLVGAIQSFFCIFIASIGVLNVMLTSVTRRTHEFAVRLAMGASRKEILGAVVFESFLISTFGAILGVTIGVLAAPHLTALIAARMPQASMLVPLYCIEGFVYPFLFCGLCGLTAGVLPALRAGRLDVLASLRAEA